MYFEQYGTLKSAKEECLVPLTIWLFIDDLDWLIKERERIGSNDIRRAMIVQHGSMYALFVNDMTGKNINSNNYDFNYNYDYERYK